MHMTSTIAEISVIAHLRIGNRDGDADRAADADRTDDGVRNGDDDADRNNDRNGVGENNARSVLCMAEASSLMAGFAPTCSAL
jgi:hypothetical protein